MKLRRTSARIPALSRFAPNGLPLKIDGGVATVGDVILLPTRAVDALTGGAWIPVRVGLVTASGQLQVTVDDGSPPSPDAYSFELRAGTTLRLRSSDAAQPEYPRDSGVREVPTFGDAEALHAEGASTEQSRAQLGRGLRERLSGIESQLDAAPERSALAHELVEQLTLTLDRLERATGRRLLAERQLEEKRGAWGHVLAELRGSLVRAEQAERCAGEAFTSAVESARDVLRTLESDLAR